MKSKVSIFWFRRDLRLEDNAGLYHAISGDHPVLAIFIFDSNILDLLDDKKDRRIDYIHQAISKINAELVLLNGSLNTFYGSPLDVFKKLSEQYAVQKVYCNRDYEPRTIDRDVQIGQFLKAENIPFEQFKDQVIFDRNEVLKNDGTPYTVFTPYSKKWKMLLKEKNYEPYGSSDGNFFAQSAVEIHSLDSIGFQKTDILFKEPELDMEIIKSYEKFRDYPAVRGTTGISMALRFGTISIRKCVKMALLYSQTWLNELIWRDFFMQILYHFPDISKRSFRAKYDLIAWRNNEKEFAAWCQGVTGYPIVDAGMRQLNETGDMHNRVRMIVASFLCKHLLIDWRWGEAYFAQKLNDYDLSANNGNWQWASGSGCDSAPYFRIFNPTTQTKRFDKNLVYIKKWVPEVETERYPEPIVEHSFARERALKVYGNALKERGPGPGR